MRWQRFGYLIGAIALGVGSICELGHLLGQ